jgi:D-sedoheptulose 7-phosphate isomerase
LDRNVKAAPATRKRFADCMAERADLWSGGDYADGVERAVSAIVRCIRDGGRVYFFGNGGSAAQAQHLAAELSGRFMLERPAWAGVALTVDTSALTAIANDYGFDRIFARQLEGLTRRGDVAVGITTSGKSANVIEGLKTAKARGATTIALSGNGGGPVVEHADVAIVGPRGPSWKVQEVQFALGHIICELAELELAGS